MFNATTILIIYLVCYVISFIIQYYYKIAYKSSFNADLIQMLPMFLLSFIWPVLLVYVIAVTILKWVSTAVLVVYVYIKDFINNAFKKLKDKVKIKIKRGGKK